METSSPIAFQDHAGPVTITTPPTRPTTPEAEPSPMLDSSPTVTLPVSDVAPTPFRTVLTLRRVDYWEMTKPRIALMVLITVVLGYFLAAGTNWQWMTLLHTLSGVFFVAGASSILNQVIEQRTDAKMPRTQNRPLPAGRIPATEATMVGIACGVLGTAQLLWFVNLTTAALTLGTLVSYVAVYTPLKRRSEWCTTIGAIPGAMPPVLGWAATGEPLTLTAWVPFGILFLWQFPHFLSIAWLYRSQYADAGLKMLPRRLGAISIGTAIALLAVSIAPPALNLTGWIYPVVAVLCGIGYLLASIRFSRGATVQTARRLLFTSLIYLPIVLGCLVFDTWLS